VAIYPKPVNERFRSPSNAASDGVGTKGTSASFVCGSFIEVSVGIGPDSDLIESASFRTNGCGFMVAAADVLCDWLKGKTLSEMHGLGDLDLMRAIGDELGVFPDGRHQCATVVFQALRNAMSANRERRIEEFQGEKALICTCFGVAEETLVDAIGQNGFTEVEQVSRAYRAGSGCGSCRFLIQELIDMRDD
jgi:NifU-like protein involved in Fe-S cluster formation/bacterioferritin-associated ferredoxin